ncbi:hypothetical protein AK812_SmicGene42410 [Symbiodinium microadriaticum]|uniref:PPM-type phosphatase domain-containing protein n=1 Tax=Symbiodinium microadriaticum TaxID=2951 RepID=A0A1Q9C3M4_SYMMI|nr:hypothetical protein AK812_SmicGene42410 [Symbiodinium microadriaticum]
MVSCAPDRFMLGENFSLYGVFDGHGQKGHDVSNFAMDMLPKCLIKDERVYSTEKRDWGPILSDAFKKTQNFITQSDKMKTLQVAIHDHSDNSVTIGHVADSTADEKARIEKAGGRVVFDGYANYRVYAKNARYPGLNMSRCLGDLLGHAECGMSVAQKPQAVDIVSKYDANEATAAADDLASRKSWMTPVCLAT